MTTTKESRDMAEAGIELPRTKKSVRYVPRAGAAASDHWPVCRHAIRYKRGALKGQPVLDKVTGEPVCFCLCIDSTQLHRKDHADLAHQGKCFHCGEKL